MWPVVLCALAATAVVAWRLTDLSVKLGRARALLERVDDLVARGMIAEAHAAARETAGPAARVIAHGLSRRAAGPGRVTRAFRDASLLETAQLERGFIALAAIATIAPLLGALATVLDLLEGAAPGAALVPAAAGALVALAASVLHLWLVARVDRFANDLERSTDAALRAIAKLHG